MNSITKTWQTNFPSNLVPMLDTKYMEQHHINQWVTWLANDTIPPPWKKVKARYINTPKLTSRKGINFIAIYLPQQSHMNSPYIVILATSKYSHYEILFFFQCIISSFYTYTRARVYPIFTIMWFDGINFLSFFGQCLGARFLVYHKYSQNKKTIIQL